MKTRNRSRNRILITILLLGCLVSSVLAATLLKQIDFTDAAVLDVVQAIAKEAGLDVVISGDANFSQNKRTSVHLKNIAAEEALSQILATNGFIFEKRAKTILISSLGQTGDSAQAGREVKTYKLKHLQAEKTSKLLTLVFSGVKASPGSSASTIILQGQAASLMEVENLLAKIDQPVPQILIESKVLEITESDSMRLGISYGKQAGVFNFVTDKDTKKTSLAENIQETVNALVTEGKAKVIATPKIATLDNQEATINIGQRIPYAVPVSSGSNTLQWSVEYIDAGVKLQITPCLGEDGYITTQIKPELSSISEWRTTTAGEFPVITTRNAQSTLRVKAGETIVVGGLLSETERENIARVPVLGYVPLLGQLFQNKTTEKAKTEIVFLITPYVL